MGDSDWVVVTLSAEEYVKFGHHATCVWCDWEHNGPDFIEALRSHDREFHSVIAGK